MLEHFLSVANVGSLRIYENVAHADEGRCVGQRGSALRWYPLAPLLLLHGTDRYRLRSLQPPTQMRAIYWL